MSRLTTADANINLICEVLIKMTYIDLGNLEHWKEKHVHYNISCDRFVDINNRLAHIEQKIDGLTLMLKELLKKGEK